MRARHLEISTFVLQILLNEMEMEFYDFQQLNDNKLYDQALDRIKVWQIYKHHLKSESKASWLTSRRFTLEH
jgi:hypothetical protein